MSDYAHAPAGSFFFPRRFFARVVAPTDQDGHWWVRPIGERGRTFYLARGDIAAKLAGVQGYQTRLATADELLKEGFTLTALQSTLVAR